MIAQKEGDETHNCGYRIHLDIVSPQKSCTVRSVTVLREAQSYCLPSGIHSKAPTNQGYLQPRGCCNTADTPPLSEFQGNKSECQPRSSLFWEKEQASHVSVPSPLSYYLLSMNLNFWPLNSVSLNQWEAEELEQGKRPRWVGQKETYVIFFLHEN